MKLSIGSVIYKLRKDKGITQESLATAIGVSKGAVSKWETGNAYPDITLLSSIARFLGTTVDGLLEFEQTLSNEDVMEIYKECRSKFMEADFEDAMKYYKKYLNEYPNNLNLKFRLGSMLQMYITYAGSEENVEIMINSAIEILEDCTESEEQEIREASLCSLSGLYMMTEKYEKAIESIDKIHKPMINPKTMLSSINYQMGNFEEAEKLNQECLIGSLGEISNVLLSLSGSAKRACDFDYAIELLSIRSKIVELFELEDTMSQSGDMFFADIYAKMNDESKTLDYLEKIVDCVEKFSDRREISSIKYFNSIKTNENGAFTQEYFENSIKMILEESRYDFVKETERYKKLLNRIL